MSINDLRKQYEKEQDKRINRNLAMVAEGVRFIDITQAYIDEQVTVGKGTVIYPGVILEGYTSVGEDCIIGHNSRIGDSQIGSGTEIQNSIVIESRVGENTKVGPFAYLRPGSAVGNDCKVGDFVEVKNSTMGDGSKASHLSYIGDSDVGEGVNIGCGVVFVNYDGSNKHRSIVEKGAFIGCNANLVSPVSVGEKAYVAAGSTVTADVPAGALYVARSKGKSFDGWVKRRGLLDKKSKNGGEK